MVWEIMFKLLLLWKFPRSTIHLLESAQNSSHEFILVIRYASFCLHKHIIAIPHIFNGYRVATLWFPLPKRKHSRQ